jgi:hypothetical protein
LTISIRRARFRVFTEGKLVAYWQAMRCNPLRGAEGMLLVELAAITLRKTTQSKLMRR